MSTTPAPGQSRPAIDTHDATPRPADTGSALTGADAARSGQTPSPVPTPVAGDTAALTPAPSPSLTLVPTGGDTTATGRRTDTAVRSVDTPSVPSTQPSGERTHKVQMGESFYSIAVKTYGNGGYYTLIQKANPTIEPDRLRPGQIINLPDPSEIKSAAAASTSAGASSGAARAPKPADRPIDAAKEYKVQSGDSLEKISIKLYGNRDQTEKLYDLNKSTIGDNPHNIKIGQILKLPSAPTVTAR
jgi:nucleoid-associated protein YgaU